MTKLSELKFRKAAPVVLKIYPREKVSFLDITKTVNKTIKASGMEQGLIHIFTRHTTTAIRINENEKYLVHDFKEYLEDLIPPHKDYHHNKLHLRNCPPNEPKNARAHIGSLFLGTSEIVPFKHGKMMLGKWQSLFFIDLDGGRKNGREIILTLIPSA